MAKASISGWIINYDVEGEGPPVLCIHGGFGGPQSALLPSEPYFGPALGDGWKRIEYHRRNCGKSEYRDECYTQDDIAAEAAGLLDHLGIDRAIIIGDSMGGTIAQSFALNYPDRVLALVLSETSAHMRDTAFYQPLHGLIGIADSQGYDAVFEKRRRSIYQAQLPPFPEGTPEERRRRLTERFEMANAAIAESSEERLKQAAMAELCNWRAHAEYDTRDRLGDLSRHRTLVIHGDADPTVPYEHGCELNTGIAGSALATIAGGQHGILVWPEAGAALRDWLSSLD